MFAAAMIPDTTIAPGTLTARGFMIGTVVTKLSEGAMPVMGATVTTSDTRVKILYPSANFMANGTSTGSARFVPGGAQCHGESDGNRRDLDGHPARRRHAHLALAHRGLDAGYGVRDPVRG